MVISKTPHFLNDFMFHRVLSSRYLIDNQLVAILHINGTLSNVQFSSTIFLHLYAAIVQSLFSQGAHMENFCIGVIRGGKCAVTESDVPGDRPLHKKLIFHMHPEHVEPAVLEHAAGAHPYRPLDGTVPNHKPGIGEFVERHLHPRPEAGQGPIGLEADILAAGEYPGNPGLAEGAAVSRS